MIKIKIIDEISKYINIQIKLNINEITKIVIAISVFFSPLLRTLFFHNQLKRKLLVVIY